MQVAIEYQFDTSGRRRCKRVTVAGKSVDDATKVFLNNVPRDKDNRDGKIYIISVEEEL